MGKGNCRPAVPVDGADRRNRPVAHPTKWSLLVLALLLAGCEQNVYEIELTP